MHSNTFIPFSVPCVTESDITAVTDVLKSGWLTTGPVTNRFEREFCEYVGAANALAVNSCTSGLHLALVASGIGQGDEVITTPLTFCATVNTILHVGATPVLADVDERLNIDPESIRARITSRTRAIVPVHFAGLPCRMSAIWALAREHGLRVVEDAAHAAGAAIGNQRIGSGQSDAVVFSFYATKNLTTGEGGMVATNSAELDDCMRRLCLHGISRDAWNRYSQTGNWYYEVTGCGFKYNMPDILAALGISQLRRLAAMQDRRAQIAGQYNERFANICEVELPPDNSGDTHSWHLYVLRLNTDMLNIDRATFIAELRARGIGCSVHFIPIPLHPYYRDVAGIRGDCPRALSEYTRLVSLPLYPGMTDTDVQRVIASVERVVRQFRKRRQVAVQTQELRGALTA